MELQAEGPVDTKVAHEAKQEAELNPECVRGGYKDREGRLRA